MTVRLSQEIGLPLVAEVAERFGIYDEVEPFPALALGAGETTLLRLTSAYAAIANGGIRVSPSFIDRVQDRNGNTIYHHSALACEECETTAWHGQDEPVLVDHRERVIDAMTAYQLTSMMEGVVLRGTATVVRQLDHPIAGKTGTSNDFHDAWFVGFTPSLVVGVYIGYDVPRNLGTGNTGGVLAAPVFTEFMRVALAETAPDTFDVPPGMELVRIDRTTGQPAPAGAAGAVVEAFRPSTAPGAPTLVAGSPAPINDAPIITVIDPRAPGSLAAPRAPGQVNDAPTVTIIYPGGRRFR
jgi:penicillin-binding protein 1A